MYKTQTDSNGQGAETWLNRRYGSLPGRGPNRQVNNRQGGYREINAESSGMSTKQCGEEREPDREFT